MKIIFAGTPEVATVILQQLLTTAHAIVAVYTQPDRPAGRGRKSTPSAVKQLALQYDIPVEQPDNLKSLPVQQQLSAYQADLIIVCAYGLLLPKAVLNTPRHGCWNIHLSLLPRWRGAAPVQRAIAAGDKQTGVCVMQMDAGLDTGDILLSKHCDIAVDDTAGRLYDKLAQLGAQALLETLQQAAIGQLQPIPQIVGQEDSNAVCYAKKIQKSEAQIDWQQSATCIERKVRAFNPWPMCYFMHQGQRIKVWHASIMQNSHLSLHDSSTVLPGTLIAVDTVGLDVITGEQQILRLLTLQLSGAKCLAVGDIINGHSHLFECGQVLM